MLPIFEVSAVDKPDSLKEGVAAGIAVEEAAPTPTPPPPAPAPAPVDAEF